MWFAMITYSSLLVGKMNSFFWVHGLQSLDNLMRFFPPTF